MTAVEDKLEAAVRAVLSPSVSAVLYGAAGRGVKSVGTNENGELIFTMTDGKEINLGRLPAGDIPAATEENIGGIRVGDSLKITGGVLSVDTASSVEKDNTKPVTSGAVYTEIGNIEVLLSNI